METDETQQPVLTGQSKIEIEADFMKKLGGPTALGKLLNRPPSTIFAWRTRGIPDDRRPFIADIARDMRVKMPKDFLVVTTDVGRYRMESLNKRRGK